MRTAGVPDTAIAMLNRGFIPDGYYLIHKLPLEMGGTNDFENLMLMADGPYYYGIINHHRTVTSGVKTGETRRIEWPDFKGPIYPAWPIRAKKMIAESPFGTPPARSNNQRYGRYLNAALTKKKEWGLRVEPTCSDEAIGELKRRAQAELSIQIPGPYIEFLRITNGLWWNGLHIYGTAHRDLEEYGNREVMTGFIEANLWLRLYETDNNYIYFATSGMSMFAYNRAAAQYEVLANGTTEAMQAHSSLDALLQAALEENFPSA